MYHAGFLIVKWRPIEERFLASVLSFEFMFPIVKSIMGKVYGII